MEEHHKILKEQYNKLPKGLQDYISSKVWSDYVTNISKQYNLTNDARIAIENELLFVLIALEPPSDLKDNLVSEAELDDNTARRITDSIHGSVLSKVMGDIKQAWKPEATQVGSGRSKNEESRTMEDKNANKPEDIDWNLVSKAMGSAQPATPAVSTNQNQTPKQYAPGEDPYRESLE